MMRFWWRSKRKAKRVKQVDVPKELLSFVMHGGQGHGVRAVDFAPDGSAIAAASLDGTTTAWDRASGRPLRALAHEARVTSVAFDPAGSLLATGSMDGTARVWDVASGECRWTLGHPDYVTCLAFSPDGSYLATGCGDAVGGMSNESVCLWNMKGGYHLGRWRHEAELRSISFSPDGAQLATTSDAGDMQLWDVGSGRRLQTTGRSNWHKFAFFSRDRLLSVTCVGPTMEIDDWLSARGPVTLEHKGVVASVTCNLEGTLFASGSYDGLVKIWDAESYQPVQSLQCPGELLCIAFSPEEPLLATGSRDGAVRLWSIEDGRLISVLAAAGPLEWMTFTPD